MGLKPDHWIRRMALEQGMIEPFVDAQVRNGVISYGLSSYGYDIRVADEFKVFQPEITASKLSDVQAAYIAGLMDAQCEIGYRVSESSGRATLALNFSGNDSGLLERLLALIGTGHLQEASDGPLNLVVSKAADVQCILSQVLPYLTRRRDTASRALAELKSNKSIIVDPKRFDADSFIDFEGDVCVIPPNSFALSRTVEYFRVPRSVLTICVGKSSYARCGIIVNVTPFEPEWEGYVTLEISNTTPLPAKIYANEGIAQVLFFQGDELCETSYADKKGKYQRQQSIVLPRLW
jgi:deoxycytidine triphosphate deaminase